MALRVKAPPRLPPGATLDQREAERILRKDPKAAFTYWEERFKALEEPVLDDLSAWNTRAGRAARALGNKPMKVLFRKERIRVRAKTEEEKKRTDELLMDFEGCLLSLDELAHELGSDTVEQLERDVAAFRQVGRIGLISKRRLASAARGLRAARELHDVARRLKWANQLASFGATAAEFLALFRQEGGFAITPGEASFPHGPLIATVPRPRCRTSRVLITGADIERPGHLLVVPWEPHARGSDTPDTPGSNAFEILMTHLLVTGGLDTLTFVRPELGGGYDELDTLLGAIPPDGPIAAALDKAVPAGLSEAQRGDLHGKLFANLLMLTFEVTSPAEGLEPGFEAAIGTLAALFATHGVIRHRRGRKLDLHLRADDDGSDTSVVLRLQALWYLSRAAPATLVAFRDRAQFAELSAFTPFCTYLRFHLGDTIFLGNLLRTLVAIPALERAWKEERRAFGAPLLAMLASTAWAGRTPLERAARLGQARADLGHWRRAVRVVGPPASVETRWRHVGLLDRLRDSPLVPEWVPEPKEPKIPDVAVIELETLRRTADVAHRTLALYRDEGLLELVQRIWQETPVDVLVKTAAVHLPRRPTRAERRLAGREPLLKAHNFDRLRRRYAAALASE